VIARIDSTTAAGAAQAVTPAAGKPEADFAGELGRAIGEASSAERSAEDASAKFAAGDPNVGLHEVMIASEKAGIAVRYAVTLKNKLIDAYRDLMSTPL
jgi:flagellar hook-basal body complex protein FliE